MNESDIPEDLAPAPTARERSATWAASIAVGALGLVVLALFAVGLETLS